MGLQLIPIAVGTAVAAAAAYVITNRVLRSRIADEALQLGRTVAAYFAGVSASDEQSEPARPARGERQPQPSRQPKQSFTSLSAFDEQTKPTTAEAGRPVLQADHQRCQAMTKAGKRCRSRTHTVVAMPRGNDGVAEVALCSVHSGIHEKGGTVPLADSSEA